MKRRIGIFGGTFDPVHHGHIEAVNSFLGSGLLDEIWILLTPSPPHKKDENKAEYSHRMEMLKLAFQDQSNIKISDLEQSLPEPSYTLQTVKYLAESHPDSIFYLCLGEDSVANFHTWYKYDEILRYCNLIAVDRPGYDSKKSKPDVLEKTIFVEHNPVDVSSSMVRKSRGSEEYHLPEEVAGYIKKNNLYQTD